MGCEKAGDVVTLTVERQGTGPDAISHLTDGKAVFVSGAVAGDVVEATITSSGKSFCKARATKVIEPSASRVKPPCPYVGVCGGCPWGALSREAQLAAKTAQVKDALVRIGHFDAERVEDFVEACEAPSEASGSRNKVELATIRVGRRVTVGMHTLTATTSSDAPEVIRVDACPLLDKRHAKLVKAVSGALSYLAGSSADIEVERVGIRASSRTGDVEVALWTAPGPFPRAQVAKVLTDATKASSVVRVLQKGPAKARKVTGVEVLSGRGFWRERIAGETMMLSAPSFFQVNTPGAERLVELVLEVLSPTESDEAMDLYSGAGTFTLPLAKRAAWVSAVEAAGSAVRDLRRNLEAAGLGNAEPIGGDAGREFPDTDADIIVVDPPRAGLAPEVIDLLSKQGARTIAYVSCDPATLARDLERFERIGTYQVSRVMPVDLFPETFHVESVVSLTRARL